MRCIKRSIGVGNLPLNLFGEFGSKRINVGGLSCFPVLIQSIIYTCNNNDVHLDLPGSFLLSTLTWFAMLDCSRCFTKIQFIKYGEKIGQHTLRMIKLIEIKGYNQIPITSNRTSSAEVRVSIYSTKYLCPISKFVVEQSVIRFSVKIINISLIIPIFYYNVNSCNGYGLVFDAVLKPLCKLPVQEHILPHRLFDIAVALGPAIAVAFFPTIAVPIGSAPARPPIPANAIPCG
ncbi:hypothetical protein AGLY_005766 [Aphis glycines]|uniref:Uncharacterized protein n=1 Tax=Aphis glycines TaxID=307491 RepID=A0A6G0TW37_APHGL|nr:hypothetical protein AGLY_005766 [Aphis glycines]